MWCDSLLKAFGCTASFGFDVTNGHIVTSRDNTKETLCFVSCVSCVCMQVVECNCSFCLVCLESYVADRAYASLGEQALQDAREGVRRVASEKKFIEAMKIPLPCPACKHVSNGLNMSMLENGSVVKGARQSASARFVSCLHIQRERRKKNTRDWNSLQWIP